MKMAYIIFLLTYTGTANVSAEATKYVLCRNPKEKIVRTLEIQKKKKAPGCETVYTKEGVSKVVGNGQNMAGCEMIHTNIQNNLEKAGWKCKDISSSAVVSY